MALFRSASSTVVPSALRTIPSPRILSRSISNAVGGTGTDAKKITHSDVKKLLDRKLVKFLKSEIKSKQLLIQKRRELNGEKIHVSPYQPDPRSYMRTDISDGESDDSDDDDSSPTDHSNSNEKKEKYRANSFGLLLNVKISKENGKEMEFRVSATDEEIKVASMLVKKPAADSDSLICYGWNRVRDSELQHALREFLEIRGITKSYIKFLYKYTAWNSERFDEYSYEDLRKLKKFIEE